MPLRSAMLLAAAIPDAAGAELPASDVAASLFPPQAVKQRAQRTTAITTAKILLTLLMINTPKIKFGLCP